MKKLFLVRHAETGDQYKGRYLGSTDVPISEGGFLQAEQLAERLSAQTINSCYCSPMRRCRQTTDIITRKISCDVTVDNQLVEIDFGRWEGATFTEICASDPEMVDQWCANFGEFTFPGGESSQHFYERVAGALDRLLACEEESVMLVAHGGVIRLMLCLLLGLNFDKYLLFNVKPATYAKLDIYDKQAVLSGFNL
nr:alpha-ribazole phosphatase [Desulfobulbaceae bacterium]